MADIIINPKCTKCKCYWKPDESDIKSSGLYNKTCKKCRSINKDYYLKNRCIHNKIESVCKECGGSALCSHNRQKSKCKECFGSSICEHNRIKSTCKDCLGSSYCIHSSW